METGRSRPWTSTKRSKCTTQRTRPTLCTDRPLTTYERVVQCSQIYNYSGTEHRRGLRRGSPPSLPCVHGGFRPQCLGPRSGHEMTVGSLPRDNDGSPTAGGWTRGDCDVTPPSTDASSPLSGPRGESEETVVGSSSPHPHPRTHGVASDHSHLQSFRSEWRTGRDRVHLHAGALKVPQTDAVLLTDAKDRAITGKGPRNQSLDRKPPRISDTGNRRDLTTKKLWFRP